VFAKTLRRLAALALPLSLLVIAAGFKMREPALIEQFRASVFDTYQRVKPRPYRSDQLRIVAIDEQSLQAAGQWPWERRTVASLVERLRELGAAAIGFDMMFLEPDRTSPTLMLERLPEIPALQGLRAHVAELPDYDQLLAESVGRGRVALGFVLTGDNQAKPIERRGGLVVSGPDPSGRFHRFGGSMSNLAPIAAAAAGGGALNVIPDADGVVRRLPLLMRMRDEVIPSFAAELLRVGEGAQTYVLRAIAGPNPVDAGDGVQLRFGRIGVPLEPDGELALYFAGSHAIRYISARSILDGTVDRAEIERKIVLIGVTALGVKDERATPLNLVVPGVEIHAEAIEQMLGGAFLTRPDWSAAAELFYVMLLGTILLFTLPRLGPILSALIGVSAAFLAAAASWVAFDQALLLIDPVTPSLIVFAVYMFATMLGFVRTEAERARVRSAFGRYLSPELVRKLAKDLKGLNLGGETRAMTLMFCDIRGFTTISEKLDPQQLTRLVNRFFTPMSREIQGHGGTIDKYIGDCIMAFWNAPLPTPDHARKACHAALAMIAALAELNRRRADEARTERREFVPLRMGIGLNTGECVVGNMGSDQRFNYTAMGDEVNMAARLEGQCKEFAVDIVISDTTEAAAAGLATLELDLVQVIGKTKPRRIFALVGDEAMARDLAFQALRQHHAEILGAMRARDWSTATQRLQLCRRLAPQHLHALYDHYARRIVSYAENPPGPGWDGVLAAARK
jgi:adenylate cyclase